MLFQVTDLNWNKSLQTSARNSICLQQQEHPSLHSKLLLYGHIDSDIEQMSLALGSLAYFPRLLFPYKNYIYSN